MNYIILKTVGHGVMESPYRKPEYVGTFKGTVKAANEYIEKLNIEHFGAKEDRTSWEEEYYKEKV